jgi:hypothetical protein
MNDLFQKYILTKTDGKPIPESDRFMVLRYSRLKTSWDSLCRSHLHGMCEEIIACPNEFPDLQEMARELKNTLEEIMKENIATPTVIK